MEQKVFLESKTALRRLLWGSHCVFDSCLTIIKVVEIDLGGGDSMSSVALLSEHRSA